MEVVCWMSSYHTDDLLSSPSLTILLVVVGITPIVQVLRGVVHDVEDSETALWLINANKTESDILLRKELEELEHHDGPTQFKQHFCLSTAPDDKWTHSVGRINLEMMRQHLPPPGEDTLMLVCGPEPMIQVVREGLTMLGWDIGSSLVEF